MESLVSQFLSYSCIDYSWCLGGVIALVFEIILLRSSIRFSNIFLISSGERTYLFSYTRLLEISFARIAPSLLFGWARSELPSSRFRSDGNSGFFDHSSSIFIY